MAPSDSSCANVCFHIRLYLQTSGSEHVSFVAERPMPSTAWPSAGAHRMKDVGLQDKSQVHLLVLAFDLSIISGPVG